MLTINPITSTNYKSNNSQPAFGKSVFVTTENAVRTASYFWGNGVPIRVLASFIDDYRAIKYGWGSMTKDIFKILNQNPTLHKVIKDSKNFLKSLKKLPETEKELAKENWVKSKVEEIGTEEIELNLDKYLAKQERLHQRATREARRDFLRTTKAFWETIQ